MKGIRCEQGGVVSFLIIAVVLASLLGAGIWWAKQARVSISTPPPGVTTDTGSSTEKNKDTTTDQTGTSVIPVKPSEVVSTGPSTEEIPSTGLSGAAVIAIGLGAVCASVYYFAISTKRLRSAALR